MGYNSNHLLQIARVHWWTGLRKNATWKLWYYHFFPSKDEAHILLTEWRSNQSADVTFFRTCVVMSSFGFKTGIAMGNMFSNIRITKTLRSRCDAWWNEAYTFEKNRTYLISNTTCYDFNHRTYSFNKQTMYTTWTIHTLQISTSTNLIHTGVNE